MAKTPIRILLLKDNPEFDEAVELASTLQQKDLPDKGAKIFWRMPPNNNTPKWVKNIFPGDRELHEALTTRSIAAVLLINYRQKTFAVTFGYGRTLLKQELIEPGFGLKVVLNRVKPDSLRSIDTKSLDGFLSHNREQVPTLSPLTSFGIDIEKDFIKAVTGISNISALGETITGNDAFFASLHFSLDAYTPVLDALISAYEATDYRNNFDFVDNIEEVPKHLASLLDEKLIQKIVTDDVDHIWLAPPEIMDWDGHGGFSFKPTGVVYDDVSLGSYLAEMVRELPQLNVAKLKRDKVLEWTDEYNLSRTKWPVYRCLYGEIEDSNKRFILSDGKWFEVNTDFVASVTDYLATNLDDWAANDLPDYDTSEMAIPDSQKRRGETKYNYYVSQHTSYTLTDADLITHGGAHSTIELCDLYKPNLFIHIKRYTRSSGLSHLFNQGKVSAELILADKDFRLKAVNKITSLGGTTDLNGLRPDLSTTHIVFGVVSASNGDLVLPFFSRVALKNAVHFLKNTLNVGKVSLVKIHAVNDDGSENEHQQ